uniref:Ankyrin repeat domain 2 n=1 Tax=Phasianus colchicus TaxID=9054 RepID=A0A669PT47_PHACC
MWSRHSCWCPWAVGRRGWRHKAPPPAELLGPGTLPAVRRRGCILRGHPSGAEHQADMELDGEKGKELEVEQITELDGLGRGLQQLGIPPGEAGHGAPAVPVPQPCLVLPQEGPVEPEDFLRAAVQGKIRVIEKFLADGGPPDTCDEFHRTALHRSSLEGHMDILQKLLDSGATVDFRDRLDSTAVHWACRGGNLDAVKLLQDRGADLNLKDKLLSTPLHVATRTGHLDIVEHLIHCGVDINSPDREGDTALHDATRLSRYKIIKMLILHGADMMARNLAGKTPTDLVQQWQVDTRQALETKERPQEETEVPA